MYLNYTLEDLIFAYKKAKSDVYYDNGHDNLIQFSEYEGNLLYNLEKLRKALNNQDSDFLFSEELLGGYKYILKGIEFDNNSVDDGFTYFSDQKAAFENVKIDELKFRFIGHHSVNFHIISSLWVEKVGLQFDSKLSERCYGSRINKPFQKFDKLNTGITYSQRHYRLLNGNFRPYYLDYKRWQEDGIREIEKAIQDKKQVAVLTADVRKFYHSVKPDFLLDKDFLKFIDVSLEESQINLTSLLIGQISKWGDNCLDSISDDVLNIKLRERKSCGLPVGLSASKVIANVFLAKFDSKIEQEVNPIHYGRYVDDIILVLANNDKFKSSSDIWKYIEKRIEECQYKTEKVIDKKTNKKKETKVGVYKSPFIGKTEVQFGQDKEKVFILENESGLSFIESLKETMNENSSEWRLLPDSNEEIEDLSRQLTSVNSSVEEQVNSLRKSDGLSIQRLKFALKLRNFETLANLVPKEEYLEAITKFFNICHDFIFTPQQFPTYLRYYPRIIGLTFKINEPKLAEKLFKRNNDCWLAIRRKLVNQDDVKDSIIRKAIDFHNDLLSEAIISNIDFRSTSSLVNFKDILYKLDQTEYGVEKQATILFLADLHTLPFKDIYSNNELYEQIKTNLILNQINYKNNLTLLIETLKDNDFYSYLNWFDKKLHVESKYALSLLLHTRPFKTLELTFLFRDWCENSTNLNEFNSLLQIFALPAINGSTKGYRISEDIENENSNRIIKIRLHNKDISKNPTLALTSFYTEESSWTSIVREDGHEPDKTRLTRLFQLLNNIIDCKKKIDYIVFPELSLPRDLIYYISKKLKSKNISLIAGIEYEIKKFDELKNFNGKISNQLLYVLNTKSSNYTEQVAIIQEKVIPAFHEEIDLIKTGGKIYEAENDFKYIIQHDKFFFSGLICNELLNIDYRQPLRGKIDGLFVVEWNKDIDMYDPIINSTSNDLHSFVIQVNNRKYGDTRVRGPYKESHARDLVRVRGGELDYFVVTSLKIKELREFQRFHRSPETPFKPVPTGFEISPERRKIDLKD